VSAKLPVSVLVVIHTTELEVLLLERAASGRIGPGLWQSVTGSLDHPEEPLAAAAAREVAEETGIQAAAGSLRDCGVTNTFEIFQQWRQRYGAGVTHNTEHVFALALARPVPVKLEPREHVAFAWLPWREAAERCFSWSNRDAIVMLGERAVIS
jgi:dATP pyrophosphohydrolase